MASSEIHSVILPRSTRARSYSAQLLTRYFVLYLGWTLEFMPRKWPIRPSDNQDQGDCPNLLFYSCTNAPPINLVSSYSHAGTGFFRSLLDSIAGLRRLVEFYVKAHNEVVPHSAFEGQTPDEVFFGIGAEVPKNPSDARKKARERRMNANRTAQCDVCVVETSSGALLLQRPRSRMF